MLTFEALHKIAAIAASKNSDRWDDVYQASWERFTRYVPRTRAGAYRMATSALFDIGRREGYQERIKTVLPDESYEPDLGEEFDAELAEDASDELLQWINVVADPATLRLLRGHASGRRRLSDDQLEACRLEVIAAVKAKANGELGPLLARAELGDELCESATPPSAPPLSSEATAPAAPGTGNEFADPQLLEDMAESTRSAGGACSSGIRSARSARLNLQRSRTMSSVSPRAAPTTKATSSASVHPATLGRRSLLTAALASGGGRD